jgi:hypothetical protein
MPKLNKTKRNFVLIAQLNPCGSEFGISSEEHKNR